MQNFLKRIIYDPRTDHQKLKIKRFINNAQSLLCKNNLDKLAKVELDYEYTFEKDAENGVVTLKVTNPSSTIAFFTFFDLIDSVNEKPILPIFWSDNYITLLPGEERTYTAKYNLENAEGEKPVVQVKAWNVNSITLK